VPTHRQGLAATATALIAAVVLAAAGCGGDGTMSTVKMAPPEVAQKLPKLPAGWKAHRDRSVGYAIGIPPQWQLDQHRGKVLLRPPDHLVAVSLVADRNGSALSLPFNRFATQALGSLPGFKVPLHPTKPKPFKGTPLQGVETAATGVQAGGLKERATLVVLRRDHFVNYTVAILENAEQAGSKLDRAVALRMVRTLRDQPVEERGTSQAP
jgi:hypothetical protein